MKDKIKIAESIQKFKKLYDSKEGSRDGTLKM